MKKLLTMIMCILVVAAAIFAFSACQPDESNYAHVHDYTAVVTKEATCTEKGATTFTCECGHTYVNESASKGHNEVVLEAVAPTCTEEGLTEGRKCQDCDVVTLAQSVIAPTGHTIGQAELTEGYCIPATICTNGCGKVFVEEMDHDYSTGACRYCDYLPGTGTLDDPFFIVTATDYVAEFPGGWDLVYYAYTAPANGWLTLSSNWSGDAWLKLGSDPYMMPSNMDMGTSYITTYAFEGTTYFIGVADWYEQENDIPFTVEFEAVESDPVDPVVGSWYAEVPGWWSSTPTIINIDENGFGTITEDYGYTIGEYQITNVLVFGTEVYVYAVDTWGNSANYQLVYNAVTNTLTGSFNGSIAEFTPYTGEPVGPSVNESELVIGTNSINATDAKFTFTAPQSGKLTLTIGGAIMGPVEITYTINGGGMFPVALGSTVEIDLIVGDEVVIDVVASGYSSITAAFGDGSGSGDVGGDTSDIFDNFENAEKLDELTYQGTHDVYLDLTATADGIFYITYNQDSALISNLPDYEKDDVNRVYAFVVSAGDVININPWTMSAEDITYIYGIYFYAN